MNVRPPRGSELGLVGAAYVWEIVKGLMITNRHFWENIVLHSLHAAGIARSRPAGVTIQYPEVRRPVPARARLLHRINRRPDGSPKCVACMLCPSVCPSGCINVVAEESPEPGIEKRPASFEIDLSRCVFCGFCVEACPVDAIRMDSGTIPPASEDRFRMVTTLDELLAGPPSDGSLRSVAGRFP